MYQLHQESSDGKNTYILKSNNLRICVCPGHGMNIVEIEYKKHKFVECEKKRFENGNLYSVPIMFPTPNRVRDNQFIFDGHSYQGRMHGSVYDTAFTVTSQGVDEDSAFIIGQVIIGKGSQLFDAFPFECELSIEIKVCNDMVSWSYTLKNRGDCVLPFGIGIHPFWNKIGKTVIKVDAESLIEIDTDKLPTGKTISIKGTSYDLRDFVDVEELKLDHFYTEMGSDDSATIQYQDIGIEVGLKATKEFTHFVVYTPEKKPYFCLENQTCSSDAHNTYNKGYKKVSGLELLEPRGATNGQVEFCFRNV